VNRLTGFVQGVDNFCADGSLGELVDVIGSARLAEQRQ